MSTKFEQAGGDWVALLARLGGGFTSVDFHRSGSEKYPGPYWERMQEVHDDSLGALRAAHGSGVPYVVFRHGWSTSVGWKKTTSRSVVRELMRSKEATPYIVRSKCIQHDSVFIAAIRPKEGS